jgi:hypothetical protein
MMVAVLQRTAGCGLLALPQISTKPKPFLFLRRARI